MQNGFRIPGTHIVVVNKLDDDGLARHQYFLDTTSGDATTLASKFLSMHPDGPIEFGHMPKPFAAMAQTISDMPAASRHNFIGLPVPNITCFKDPSAIG
jgi:hypothetical protein